MTPEAPTTPTTAEARVRNLGDTYEGIPVLSVGKRCGLQWAPWMGNWFVSWSPRNENSNAEGYWDHWATLALAILQDPMTAKVYPAAHAAVAGMQLMDLYDGPNVHLSCEDLAERFAAEVNAANGGAV